MQVLGIAQDAGYPQAACQKNCCKRAVEQPENKRLVSCLALIDPISQQRWLFDATPDFREQLQRLKVTPYLVPHRDEFSETVGFKIEGASKSALFIPDIDKWHLWDRDILKEIEGVDYAFLDATFYANGEIAGRDMSQIPHPFMEESLRLFADLPTKEKVHFIHFNHTNPVLDKSSDAHQNILKQGFRVAKEMSIWGL
ncbi:MAG: MBL fold metallo-hydrolase [Chitinophagales bacterium]